MPALRKLQEDQDADVRYFATKAYERTTGDDVRGAEPMSKFIFAESDKATAC